MNKFDILRSELCNNNDTICPDVAGVRNRISETDTIYHTAVQRTNQAHYSKQIKTQSRTPVPKTTALKTTGLGIGMGAGTETHQYCNNCGMRGHSYNTCEYPITSIGIIAYKYDVSLNDYVFLMIRRRNTLGFVDFMRGKYNLYDKMYIQNLVNEMTKDEKKMILQNSFQELWGYLWQNTYPSKYKNEEKISLSKFETFVSGVTTNNETYTLEDIVRNSTTHWIEEEWGFPKGRRSYQEKDTMTAVREFSEETGYNINKLELITNIMPFQEIFTGSNFKSYKHKYYLAKIIDNDLPRYNLENYQVSEVSKIEWKTLEECISCIRPYNQERMKIIKDVYRLLHKFTIVQP